MQDELVTQSVELPSGELSLLQPEEAAELPDDGPVEWAPTRSLLGSALAQRRGARP